MSLGRGKAQAMAPRGRYVGVLITRLAGRLTWRLAAACSTARDFFVIQSLLL